MASLSAALNQLATEMNSAEQAIADAITATQTAVEGDLRGSESVLLPCVPAAVHSDLTRGEVPPKKLFHPKA